MSDELRARLDCQDAYMNCLLERQGVIYELLLLNSIYHLSDYKKSKSMVQELNDKMDSSLEALRENIERIASQYGAGLEHPPEGR